MPNTSNQVPVTGVRFIMVLTDPSQGQWATPTLSAPTLSPISTKMVDMALLETEILPSVNKPGRYMGIEQGAFRKPFDQARATMAMAFPDLYEIGISNYGVKLLYSVVNHHPHYMCDRVYAAAPDFRSKLEAYDIPLYGVESCVPIKDFDLLAFTLQYELNYTTILGMLESAHIPFRAAQRNAEEENGRKYPILIAGGPGSGNPMSIAPFFDAFIIGDGEEILIEILDVLGDSKEKGWTKAQTLKSLSKIPGMYLPGITERAYKRIVDIAQHPVDLAPLVPTVEAVHDRVTIEARRGCDRMCRFCQPCFINLPVREQTIEAITQSALHEIEKTGYEECSLLSLSIADYSQLKPLVQSVSSALKEKTASISLPSQRADRFNIEVAEAVQSVRKSTLTFAPEAGTPRLRDVINKNLTDEEILNAVTTAYKAGWNKVKLYFIIGLPTETHADLDGIVDLVVRMREACAQIKRDPALSIKNHLDVNVTLSNFVPKPHTPFQWFPQETMASMGEKIQYLKDAFRGMRGVKLNFTDPEISKLEAVISKAGPELADVMELAYKNGAYLDAWDDMNNFARWFKALEALGFDHEAYTRERACDPQGTLPWDCIDVGLEKEWLISEYNKALAAASTTPCFEHCSMCGVCPSYDVMPTFTPESSSAQGPAENTPTAAAATAILPPKAERPKALPTLKIRLMFQKRGKLRFVSHLDWLRLIQKAIVKSGIPVAYSLGFNPKPRISFGPALPLMMEGMEEFVDVDLLHEAPDMLSRINAYLPADGQIQELKVLPLQTSSIDKSVKRLDYTAWWTCQGEVKPDTIKERVKVLMSEPQWQIRVETKKKTRHIDLKPYLADLRLEEDSSQRPILRFSIHILGPHLELTQTAPDQLEQPKWAKPEWLLTLIEPNLHWHIIRERVVLAEPSLNTGHSQNI